MGSSGYIYLLQVSRYLFELLNCAHKVTSALQIAQDDDPVEGYYTVEEFWHPEIWTTLRYREANRGAGQGFPL